jgi:protein Mpv17
MMMSRIFAIVVNVLTVTLSLRSTSAWVVPSSSLLSVRGTTQFILKSSSIAKSVPGTPALQLRTSRLTLSAVEVAGNGESSTTTTSSSSVSSSIREQQHLQVVSMENYDENSFNSSNNKLKTVSTTTKSINGESSELSTQQKVINALFLSAAFGYGIYTILNIDSGLTRGWSASEIAMRIPLDNWGAYESYLANKPIVTKTLINVIIYLLGDWLSQTVFQKKNVLDFDISRTLRNGFIGLCFGPCVHQYYEFSDAILPPELGLVTRLEKIVMDQTIYLTVKCSIYICAVGLLAGEDFATVKQRVKDKIVGIVFTAWKFWPLVHCITYRCVCTIEVSLIPYYSVRNEIGCGPCS